MGLYSDMEGAVELICASAEKSEDASDIMRDHSTLLSENCFADCDFNILTPELLFYNMSSMNPHIVILE